jgi:DedD protein
MRMRGVFDEEEPVPLRPRRDTDRREKDQHDRELTLGSGALLALFGGLVLLCAVCFGLGYALGHRGSAAAVAAALPAPAQPIEASNALAKPSATAQTDQAPSADANDPAQPADGAAPDSDAAPNVAANTAPDGQAAPAAMQSNGAPGQPAVHPALVSAPAAGQAVPAAGVQPPVAQSSLAQAAPTAAGSVMVQIAAVSHAEDADVLANALRKRGYAVTERRDPADNLIHVRIGPFATLAEAISWRNRLLGDGYNAVVQQ